MPKDEMIRVPGLTSTLSPSVMRPTRSPANQTQSRVPRVGSALMWQLRPMRICGPTISTARGLMKTQPSPMASNCGCSHLRAQRSERQA